MKRTVLLVFFLIAIAQIGKAQTKVKFYTTLGDFEVLLYDSLVPITAGNFIDLVNQKYYDGVIFHRVIDNFMIQGGDPTGTGSGGPGYSIDDEFDSSLSNIQKTISMANSGPNTGGSQFFINLVNNTYLDYDKNPLTSKHAVFGLVTDSFEVVQRIGSTPTNISNRPRTDVVMDSVRVLHPKPNYEQAGVYPNPLQAHSMIHFEHDFIDVGFPYLEQIECLNSMGQAVWSATYYPGAWSSTISLSALYKLHLTPGIYTLRTQEVSIKIVVAQ